MTEKAKLTNPDGKSLAVVLADLNNDGWPDIFIANDTERNFIYLNNGDGTFKDITYASGAAYSEDGKPEAGMSADAADLTGTGRFDIYVSHLDFELNRLYRNDGKANFNDETVDSGLGSSNIKDSSFGARFFDFDNDGLRDLLVINGHILDNIPLIHSEVTYAEPKSCTATLAVDISWMRVPRKMPDFSPRMWVEVWLSGILITTALWIFW